MFLSSGRKATRNKLLSNPEPCSSMRHRVAGTSEDKHFQTWQVHLQPKLISDYIGQSGDESVRWTLSYKHIHQPSVLIQPQETTKQLISLWQWVETDSNEGLRFTTFMTVCQRMQHLVLSGWNIYMHRWRHMQMHTFSTAVNELL